MTKRKILAIVFFLFICTVIFSESYRFDPGIYYLLDGRINVRSEPNLSGRIIGQLNTNSQVKIIECAFNEQIMDGVSAYWYKIEYNNSFGYIWGGFIAVETLVHDINNNGINDYFHYRISRMENGISFIDSNKDVFVYIDNNHIQSNFILDNTFVHSDQDWQFNSSVWNRCVIEPHKPTWDDFMENDVAIWFIMDIEGIRYSTNFIINRNGNIFTRHTGKAFLRNIIE